MVEVISIEKPVFILGLHRTGSTLLKNMLDQNSKLSMAIDEMHIKTPWKSNDFISYYDKNFPYKDARKLTQFLNEIFGGKIYGSFWVKYEPSVDSKANIVKKYLSLADPTAKDLLNLILDEYRKGMGKERVGVKYPLHFKYSFMLKNWFPDAKIIFLVRDIRAICASKVRDEATKKRKKRFTVFSALVHYLTIFGFVYDYYLSYLHMKQGGNRGVLLIRYEDLLLNPIDTLKSVCSYCEIPYEDYMIQAFGKPSSYLTKIEAGLDVSRINKWKLHLNQVDQWLISALSRNSLKYFRY